MHAIPTHLVTIAAQSGPMLLAAAIVALATPSRDVRLQWLAVAIGLILLEDLLLTGLWLLIPQPDWWGPWNWTGKLLALAGMLYVATLRPMGLDATGVRMWQNEGSGPAWAASAAACVAVAIAVWWFGGGRYQGTDTLIYQTVLAAPEEELFYRGLLFLALDRAFRERRLVLGTLQGPAVLLTALCFAGFHGIARDGAGFTIRPELFATWAAAGLFLGWVRARTGSLLAPTIVHVFVDAVRAIF